ncbi:ATP-binding cassette domain-containing protein [Microbacterium sp.]|uniref:ABC transporter ATP-binding protein n=1 Tax=Microbacterium sp. TaxID=51671 RepID=UPI0035B280E7
MTASLPVSNDIDPEEPDRHEGASVVALPASPPPPRGGKTPARKPRKAAPEPTGEPALQSDAADDPAAPPPLSDLETAERAAVDLVIPPKPPLPDEGEAQGEAEPEVAPEIATEPEPEPEIAPQVAPEPEITPEPEVALQPEIAPEPANETAPPPSVLAPPVAAGDVLVLRGVSKRFGDTHAVDGIDLTVPAGTFYGLVGPNGAGKTTTLSMIAGLLEPDRGSIRVGDVDAASDPVAAKRLMGVLPDRLRTFDRLTGRQLLYYYGVLRGLAPAVVESRTADLARAFDLTDALGRVVSDYSAGMVKKVMLAGALIHSPRVLVLDEPFEAVDPVSSAIILDILSTYVAHGGTVILSSHGMELVERVCSRVAVIVAGQVLAEGTVDEVRGELSLEQRFIELAGGLSDVEGLEWLHTFSD